MPTAHYESLDEAIEALAGCDIGLKNGNSNHAPMVAEVLCAMGRPQAVMPWIARYKERLLPRPRPAILFTPKLGAARWADATASRIGQSYSAKSCDRRPGPRCSTAGRGG